MQSPARSYYESNRFSVWWRSGLARMVTNLLPPGWQEMELLDAGVGDGYTIRLVKPSGKINGTDFDPKSIDAARGRGIAAEVATVYQIPYPDNSFDVVTCLEVLEHLSRPADSLKEIRRVLRPNGYFLATTPVPNLRWRLLWWLWTKFGPGKRWAEIPHVSHLHVGERPSHDGGLISMLDELGFEVVKTGKCNYGMVAGLLARKVFSP